VLEQQLVDKFVTFVLEQQLVDKFVTFVFEQQLVDKFVGSELVYLQVVPNIINFLRP
jgi:hypothetical protein